MVKAKTAKQAVKEVEAPEPVYSTGDYLAVYQEGEDLNFSLAKVLEDVEEDAEYIQVLYFNRVKENHFSSHNKDEIKSKSVIQLVPVEQVKATTTEPAKSTTRPRAASKSKALAEPAPAAKEELLVDPKYYKALKLAAAKFKPEETEAEEDSDEDEDLKASKPKLETQPLKIRRTIGPAKSLKSKKRSKKEDGSEGEEESDDEEAFTKSIKKAPGVNKKVSVKPMVFTRGKGNPKVSIVAHCAQLESESLIPNYECSTRNSNREVIRAAKIKSKKLFDKLINSEYKLSRLTERWGIENSTTALKIILSDNNEELLIPYLEHIISNHGDKNKLKLGSDNAVSLQKIETGFNDKYAYGVATRQVSMSRGGREGNNAFVEEGFYSADLDDEHIEFMVADSRVSLKIIQTILSYFPNIENQLISKINVALRYGRVAVAAFLMERCLKNGGYGLSEFYIPALTGSTLKGLEDIKKPSCTKKAFGLGNFSPIHCACLNPNVLVLKHLLTVNPEYLNMDESMRKPVHYAACCDSAEPLKYLVSQQVDTREMDNQRTSPLMYAARAGKVECVKFLLQENRSVPNHKDRKGFNAIHYAAEGGHFEVIQLLVEKAGIKLDLPGPERKTSMHIAAGRGDFELVENLLRIGSKTIHKDKFKRTALLLAAKNGNLKVASLLLSKGAPFEEPDSSGNTPLHYACAYGYPEMIDLLIQAGANPNSMNSWKLSPTAVALMKSYFSCLRKMLDNPDTNVNCIDDQGRTLVSNSIIAINSENYNHVSFLLKEKKADLNIPDIRGFTALDHLCSHNIETLATIQFKPKMTSEEKEGVRADMRSLYKKYFKLFIECQADINHRDTEGLTPIFRAIGNANGDAVGYLLDEKHIELNIISKQKLSVLHYLDKLVGSPGYVVIADKILKKCDRAGLINLYSDLGYTPVLAAFEQYMNILPGLRGTIFSRMEQELKEKKFAEGAGKKKAMGRSKLDEEGGESCSEDEDDEDEDDEDRPRYAKKKYPGMKGGARTHYGGYGKVAMKAKKRYPGQYVGSEEGNLATNLALTSEEIVALNKEADLEFNERVGEFLEFLRLMRKNEADLNLFVKNPKKEKGVTGKLDEEEKNEEDDPEYFVENYFRILEDLLDRQVKEKFNLKKKSKISAKVGYSLLHLSCKAVNNDIIMALLGEFKIPLNQRSVYGESELHCFIAKVPETDENEKIFDMLIQRGANVEARDLKLNTPLLLTVKNSKPRFLKVLLKFNALINAQDIEGNYPLLQAVKSRQLQNVITLAENGADPNIQDEDGRTCMHWAINFSQSDADASNEIENTLVSFCRREGNMNMVDERGRTPLHYAFIKIGDPFAFTNIDPIETVSNIISRPNVKIDLRDNWGNTPLHYAAQRGSVISALYLMKNGADFNALNDDGNSPLNICLLCGHQNMAIFLIQKGVNLKLDIKVKTPSQKRAELEKKKQEEAKDGEENSDQEADEEYDEDGELIVRKKKRRNLKKNLQEVKEEAEYESSESILEEETQENTDDVDLQTSGFEEKKRKMPNSNFNFGGGFGGGFNGGFGGGFGGGYAKVSTKWGASTSQSEPNNDSDTIFGVKESTCSTFSVAIRRNWQSVAFLMLEFGFDLSLAILDCFNHKKYNYVYTLLLKKSEAGVYQMTNTLNQNLTHLFALNSNSISQDLFDKIYKNLEAKKLDFKSLDSFGKSSLHYACQAGSIKLITLLLNKGLDINLPDKQGMTPLGNIVLKNFHKTVEFVNLGQAYRLEVNKKFPFKNKDHTVLTYSAQEAKPMLVFHQLAQLADINIGDCDGWRPIVHMIRQNREDDIRSVLTALKQSLDLQVVDEEGRTLIHHVVMPKVFGSYENAALLELLIPHVDINKKDKKGNSPLVYAKLQESGVLYKVLLKHKAIESSMEPDVKRVHSSVLHDLDFPEKIYDYEKDFDLFLEQCKAELKDEKVEFEEKFPVDPNCPGNYEVTYDGSDPHDCYMVKVDIAHGYFSGNTFYKMQILREKVRDVYILFTRWGRVGSSGQFQQTPFSTMEEAKKEFCSIFKSKSGNLWENRASFTKVDKKYRLVPYQKKNKVESFIKAFNYKDPNVPASKLPKVVFKLLRRLCNYKVISKAISQVYNMDQDVLPMHMISRERVLDAEAVVKGLENTLKQYEEARSKRNLDTITELAEELSSLTSRYYELLPSSRFREQSIPPITSSYQLDNIRKQVNDLIYFEIVIKLIAAATFRMKQLNPIDYCFQALSFKTLRIEPFSEEFNLLKEYVTNGRQGQGIKNLISNIYAIERKGEKDLSKKWSKSGNKMLLWHGTKGENLVGILQNGFRIAPSDARKTGSMFGEGIYFADIFNKALQYSQTNNLHRYNRDLKKAKPSKRYVFLCEVNLGKMKKLYQAEQVTGIPNSEYQSVMGYGRIAPDPKGSLYVPSGMIIPVGRLTQNPEPKLKKDEHWALQHNEFVVYDTSQVRVRYLFELRDLDNQF